MEEKFSFDYLEHYKMTSKIHNVNDRILHVLLQYKKKKSRKESKLLKHLNKLYSHNVNDTEQKIFNLLVECGYIKDSGFATWYKKGEIAFDGRELTPLGLEALRVDKFISESSKISEKITYYGISILVLSIISTIFAVLTFFGKESVIEMINNIFKKQTFCFSVWKSIIFYILT